MRTIALLLVLATPALCLGDQSCSEEEAISAESVTPFIESWSGLQRAFKQYGHCDDGSIGEGFSETVARLITSSGPKLQELQSLSKTDPKFRSFVVRHVDATLLPGQLSAIERQMTHSCPRGAKALCNEITASARKAKSELPS